MPWADSFVPRDNSYIEIFTSKAVAVDEESALNDWTPS